MLEITINEFESNSTYTYLVFVYIIELIILNYQTLSQCYLPIPYGGVVIMIAFVQVAIVFKLNVKCRIQLVRYIHIRETHINLVKTRSSFTKQSSN